MKKQINKFLCCMIALAALLLPGCNSEETLIDNSVPVEKGKLSFVLPLGGDRTVTYAASDGLDEEYTLHNLRIYWFDAADNLHRRLSWGESTSWGGEVTAPDDNGSSEIELTPGTNTTTITIQVGDYTELSKFYIVANVNGDGTHPDMISSSALLDIQNGQAVSRQEFEAILSDALNANGKTKLLGVPIPMSIADTTNTKGGYIEVSNPQEVTGPIEAKLKRRVARFDVINTADYSNFEITKIVVSRAQTKGFMHDSLFSKCPTASWDAASTYKFEVTQPVIADPNGYAFNGPTGSGVDSNNNGIDDAFEGGPNQKDSTYLTKAAFYLYPTTVTEDDTKTQISIEGVFNKTVNRIYTLDLSSHAGNSVDIDANKLYRIRVVRDPDKQLRFKLDVADWDDVDTITTVSQNKLITDWGVLTSTADASLAEDIGTITSAFEYEYSSSATNPDTLVFQTQGYRLGDKNSNTEVSFIERDDMTSGVDYLASDFNRFDTAKVITTNEVTYAGGVYTTTHKIVLPPTNAPISVRLLIANAADASNNKIINIRSNNYGLTGFKPVRVGNTLWAPLNVGASIRYRNIDFTTNATGDSIVGKLYQWGRSNVGFNYSGTPGIIQGPLSAVAASQISLYITRTSNVDWCDVSDDDMWSGANAQGPCPEGWRVPTKNDFDSIYPTNTKVKWVDTDNKSYSYAVSLATNDTIYFPFCGRRASNAALDYGNDAANNGETGLYWTSTINSASTQSPKQPWRMATKSNHLNISENRCNAMGVRAVRDLPATP
jgi:uncharacterized protein (TIGR02145 family)